MRRHKEQLQSVATSGVDGRVSLTAPQWQEPSCMLGFQRGATNAWGRGLGAQGVTLRRRRTWPMFATLPESQNGRKNMLGR